MPPTGGGGPRDGLEFRSRRYRRLYQPATADKDEFVHQAPAQIFAHLLKLGPTPHQLAALMANDAELLKRVQRTGDGIL